jgi:hypothetical protein
MAAEGDKARDTGVKIGPMEGKRRERGAVSMSSKQETFNDLSPFLCRWEISQLSFRRETQANRERERVSERVRERQRILT